MSNESGFEYGISDDESQETDEAHAGHNGNGNGNGHRLTPRMVAEQVLMWDIMPIPLTNRADPKNVNRPAWEKERYTARDLDAFNDAIGVGFRLGHILDAEGNALTDRFADADLDTHEAVRCAEFYLPYTGMKWGRDNKPRSHWGYRLKSLDGAKSRQMTDPLRTSKDGGKDMICELRFSGHTVGPASYNVKEGLQPDLVRWEPDGDGPPSEVEFEKRLRSIWVDTAGADDADAVEDLDDTEE